MKDVAIISRSIPANPRSKNYAVGSKVLAVGGSYSGDKLDTSVWARNFEEKEDSNGTKYLALSKPLVAKYGVTFNASETPIVPSVFAALPHDDTLAWIDNKLSVVGGGGSGGGSVDSVSVDGVIYTPDENKDIALPVFRSTSLQRSLLPIIQSDGVMEINRYLDFHYDRQFSNDYDARISIDDNRKLEIDATNGIIIHSSTSQILNISGGDLYLGGNTLPHYTYLENNNSDYAHSFRVANQNIPNGSAAIWHEANTYYWGDNDTTYGLNTQTIDLTAGSTDLFYPCYVTPNKMAWECEIHSPSSSGDYAWNQNYIKFTLFAHGWSDLTPMFTIHNYAFYEEAEKTIGGICRGTTYGSCCVYLRGGLKYNVKSSRKVFPSLVSVTPSGNERYNVGSNSTNVSGDAITIWDSTSNGNTARNQATVFGNNVVITAPLFCYHYINTDNAATIIIDKPNIYLSGMGANGESDTIYFGACNKDGQWENHSQIWKFNGAVIANQGFKFAYDNIITNNETYTEIASGGDEIVVSGGVSMWVNYRISALGKLMPTNWHWGIGDNGATYASHHAQNYCCKWGGDVGGLGNYTNGDLTLSSTRSGMYLRLVATNSSIAFITTGNNGAIAASIDQYGNFLAIGGVTFRSTSDLTLKKNIRPVTDASKRLMSLGGVYDFEYIDEEIARNTIYAGEHIGLIYQNVADTCMRKMCHVREDGKGSLNYIDTSFISLIAAVEMEHETRLQAVESKLEKIERRFL